MQGPLEDTIGISSKETKKALEALQRSQEEIMLAQHAYWALMTGMKSLFDSQDECWMPSLRITGGHGSILTLCMIIKCASETLRLDAKPATNSVI